MELIRKRRGEVWKKGEIKGWARRDERSPRGNEMEFVSPPPATPPPTPTLPCHLPPPFLWCVLSQECVRRGGLRWLVPRLDVSTVIMIQTIRSLRLCGSINICWINLKAKWLFLMCIIQMIVPNLLFFLSLFFFFCPPYVACWILVPDQGLNPRATVVRAPSPNHWTAREIHPPPNLFFVWARKTLSVVKWTPDFVLDFSVHCS